MAVSFTQGTGAQSSGSVASLSKAFTSNVTAGNLIAVGAVANADTLGTSAASDGLANLYERAVISNGIAAGNAESAIYYAKNVSGGACTVTLDPTGSDFVSLVIAEGSGCDTTAPLDGTGTFSGDSTNYTTSSWTTTAAALTFGVMEQNQSGTTITPGATLTQIFENENVTSAMPINGEYRLDASAGAGKTVNWTLGSAKQGTACGCSFKESAGGGGATATVGKLLLLGCGG